MSKCKHDFNINGRCVRCGMGATWLVAFQMKEIDRLKGEVESLTDEREVQPENHALKSDPALAGYIKRIEGEDIDGNTKG